MKVRSAVTDTKIAPRCLGISLMLMIFCAQAIAQVHDMPVKHWVDEANQTVRYLAEPNLRVELIRLEADERAYAQLNINFEYEVGTIAQHLKQLQETYPNFAMRRLLVQETSGFRLQIPELGIDQEVRPKNGVEGPYLRESLILSRSQYNRISGAMKTQSPLVTVAGSVGVRRPSTEVIEEAKFDSSLCLELAPQGANLINTIERLTDFARRRLGSRQVRFESTRQAVLEDIMSSCFSLSTDSNVRSFKDLTSTPVKGVDVGRSLLGQTTRVVELIENVSVQPIYTQKER